MWGTELITIIQLFLKAVFGIICRLWCPGRIKQLSPWSGKDSGQTLAASSFLEPWRPCISPSPRHTYRCPDDRRTDPLSPSAQETETGGGSFYHVQHAGSLRMHVMWVVLVWSLDKCLEMAGFSVYVYVCKYKANFMNYAQQRPYFPTWTCM